jgi:hypothetical protein
VACRTLKSNQSNPYPPGFDISREAGSEPLVKSFQHIEPTPQGKIEIYFTPAVNYPSISAIEIIPE